MIRTSMGIQVLKDDTHMSRLLERTGLLGAPAVEEVSHYAHLIKPGDAVVDAGCCLGDHAAVFAQLVGSEGCVHAFEPYLPSFECAKANLAIYRNVALRRIGIGADDGRFVCAPDKHVGATRLVAPGNSVAASAEINVYALDQLFTDRVDFIHLDVEGMEPLVIQGALKLLERWRPVMVIEVCTEHLDRYGWTPAELRSFVRGLGYRVEPIIYGEWHMDEHNAILHPL